MRAHISEAPAVTVVSKERRGSEYQRKVDKLQLLGCFSLRADQAS